MRLQRALVFNHLSKFAFAYPDDPHLNLKTEVDGFEAGHRRLLPPSPPRRYILCRDATLTLAPIGEED